MPIYLFRGCIQTSDSICCVIFSSTYSIINTFSVGIDFRRQNLTSVDVRFSRWKLITAPKK